MWYPAARLSVVVARKVLNGFECPSLTVSALCTCKGRENAAVRQGGKTIKGGEEHIATLMIYNCYHLTTFAFMKEYFG